MIGRIFAAAANICRGDKLATKALIPEPITEVCDWIKIVLRLITHGSCAQGIRDADYFAAPASL